MRALQLWQAQWLEVAVGRSSMGLVGFRMAIRAWHTP